MQGPWQPRLGLGENRHEDAPGPTSWGPPPGTLLPLTGTAGRQQRRAAQPGPKQQRERGKEERKAEKAGRGKEVRAARGEGQSRAYFQT